MQSSSGRQVRSTSCLLNVGMCKTDNWRRSILELQRAAGQVQPVGVSTALDPQLSVRHTLLLITILKLISVCVCLLKFPLVSALQRMRDVSGPAYHGLG